MTYTKRAEKLVSTLKTSNKFSRSLDRMFNFLIIKTKTYKTVTQVFCRDKYSYLRELDRYCSTKSKRREAKKDVIQYLQSSHHL